MKSSLFTALLLFLSVTFSFAQTTSIQVTPPLTEGTPRSTGMSAERLARIDSMAIEALRDDKVPGIVALVARDGKIIYHKTFGFADAERTRPLRKDDIFRIASQSKAITSTAVMMLWEQGKFQLDDPISEYIPEFADAQVLDTFNEEDSTYTTIPANKPITIRHLITHTSGIGYGIIDGDPRMRKIYQKAGIVDLFTLENITIEENIKKLAALPLHHHPGEKFTYSEGLDVLGYFVEVISGQPFDDYLREHIFNPLQMDDTWFYLPEQKEGRLVQVQQKNEDGEWIPYTGTEYYDASYPIKGAKTFFSGGAGLSSTAEDYAKFLQMYLNGGEYGGVRLLSRTTVNLIMANQVGDLLEGEPTDYGLAFGLTNMDGFRNGEYGSPGTFDWGGYFNTQYWAEPDEQLIGIIMKQTRGDTGDETGWKFRVLARQAVDD
ncbi:serine hydrolase domain-containing protein [Gracilimonas mengyeensis]|uniref:CubicO group peptidase, beta-lactamase class C family n=1 Tax=Gracilimonas mengyeensis TaxID=1302730 RepID=A0A521BCS9_9BACT|nr:serine hydrolase domain-containing protein [Gracilimonas mengyeensis]SMO44878.1 CubicO group peptidase, beta-lactamase class C family [Gracilimonas mengyeensis]